MADVGNEFGDSAKPGITAKAVKAVDFSFKAVDYCVGKTPIVGSTLSKIPCIEFEQNFPSL